MPNYNDKSNHLLQLTAIVLLARAAMVYRHTLAAKATTDEVKR
ncbi:hypothetical protein P4S63_02160 [Pseudoalteromonas sp. B193]